MKPIFLQLKFEPPDLRSTAGNAWIIPGDHCRDENDWPLLTPHCATLGELEWHIDRILAELEEIRKQARKKFAAAAKAKPPTLEELYS
jgi:hypothetical protein